MSRLCAEIDERGANVSDLIHRGRLALHLVVNIAVGANTDGRREVLGMIIGNSEAEPFWTEFLRFLARRGLRGVKLVISDAHEGLRPPSVRCSERHGSAAVWGC